MDTAMLLLQSTFENLDCGQKIATDGSCRDRSSGPDRSELNSTLNAIARQIEAEIPFLRRVVRRWQRQAADADDLVQDTLLRALASAHLWQPGSNLRAWLVTIMRNQCLATLSRAKRSQAAAEMLHMADSVATDVEARLTLRDVDRAFRRLPEKQRSAVLLAGIEGKSYAEVATALGMTADAVRCHLARARGRLRTAVYKRDETNWVRPAAASSRQ
jgi:RNA polymerase sigma-70 factor, ECF subfamily